MVGFGLNAVDWICRLPDYPPLGSERRLEALDRLTGGQTATACALCARYGLQVRYIGRVGDDALGNFSRQHLRAENMDLSCVETVSGTSNQFAVILVDRPTGERTILWERSPSLTYEPGDLRREWIEEGQLLHLDGHDEEAAIEAAGWAQASGMKVSLDIDKVQERTRDLIERVDFLLPTERFARRMTGVEDWTEALSRLNRMTPGLVAITRGEEGCAVIVDGQILEVPAFQVPVVDTTGAGDIFHGAFAFSLFQGWDLLHCLTFACAAGSLACTRVGSRSGIPTLAEVESLTSQRLKRID